jgi:dTDP-4-dehydrorhamnose reductase
LSVYGRSKAEAERLVEQVMPSALIVRSSALFGPWDESNFVFHALQTLAAGHHLLAANNVIVSPTYVPDLVNACLDLLIDGERGIWHLANVGRISWSELAKEVASLAALNSPKLVPRPLEQLHLRAARPLFSALSSERAILMPTFEDALSRYFQDCEVDWRVREQRPQQLTA